MDAGSTAFSPCSAYLHYSAASSRASASRSGKSADSCVPHIASARERIGGLLLATECLMNTDCQNPNGCAYSKPKPGRIDDAALQGLVSLPHLRQTLCQRW